MKLSSENLIGIRVETESGQQLGTVESFNLETESQSVLEYIVKPNNKVKELISGDLIIPRGQVISISAEKIIVDDNAVSDKEKIKDKKTAEQEAVSGAMMSKKN